MAAAPHPTVPDPSRTGCRWHVRLLGTLELVNGPQRLTRLPSRAVAALLARLALWPERSHAREELVDLLWPGVDLAVGRNRLRQALSTLKGLLEAPGAPPVLLADRLGVRVALGALVCDVGEFEAHWRAGRHAAAAARYGGELLPGFYDEWIDDERRRLAALAERISDHVAGHMPAPPAAPATLAVAAPPALRSSGADVGRSSLPAYLTRFFAAEPQAARLRGQVLAHRLVTLTGPGGSGKTRLAVELAQSLRDTPDFRRQDAGAPAFDLVAFVPLAACNDAAALPDHVLAALQLRSGAALDGVVQALAGRHVLLVLDNLEQLLPQAAPWVAGLVAALPRLHLLVTSRRLLALDGEREMRVEPLALPPADATLDEAAASPALALFVDRARAARADFHLGPRNAAVLCALVQALQGMPLAIELAASRVRAFTPAEMLQRLQAGSRSGDGRTPGLDLLARNGPRAGFDPRHASMHRVIAWSWEQLSAPQAALLAALTVFEGGFTAAAARGVSGNDDADTLVDELLAHSLLLSRAQADGGLRFALYEPIREFAAAQLDPAAQTALRRQHRAWWPRWADGLGPTPPLAALRAEMPNLGAAMAGAVADGVPDDALRLALALRRAFIDSMPPASLLLTLQAAIADSADTVLQSRVHSLLGVLSFDAGRREAALQHVEQGLALAPAAGPLRARALHALCSVRWRSTRQAEALRPLLAEAMAQAGDDADTRASLLALQAFIANAGERDFARGEALHRQALALWSAAGNQHAVNAGRYNLAICAFNARRWHDALAQVQAVCAAVAAQDDWQQWSQALNLLGNTFAALRDWPAALQAYRDCADIAWRALAPYMLAYGLWNAPRALAHGRRPQEAAQLMGFAARYWVAHFGPLSAADALDLRRVRRLVAAQIGAAAAAAAHAEGAALTLGDAVALLRRAPIQGAAGQSVPSSTR